MIWASTLLQTDAGTVDISHSLGFSLASVFYGATFSRAASDIEAEGTQIDVHVAAWLRSCRECVGEPGSSGTLIATWSASMPARQSDRRRGSAVALFIKPALLVGSPGAGYIESGKIGLSTAQARLHGDIAVYRDIFGRWKGRTRACSLALASEAETGSTLLGQRKTKPSSLRVKSSNVNRSRDGAFRRSRGRHEIDPSPVRASDAMLSLEP